MVSYGSILSDSVGPTCACADHVCMVVTLIARRRDTFPFGNLAFSLSLNGKSAWRWYRENIAYLGYLNTGIAEHVTGY